MDVRLTPFFSGFLNPMTTIPSHVTDNMLGFLYCNIYRR